MPQVSPFTSSEQVTTARSIGLFRERRLAVSRSEIKQNCELVKNQQLWCLRHTQITCRNRLMQSWLTISVEANWMNALVCDDAETSPLAVTRWCTDLLMTRTMMMTTEMRMRTPTNAPVMTCTETQSTNRRSFKPPTATMEHARIHDVIPVLRKWICWPLSMP